MGRLERVKGKEKEEEGEGLGEGGETNKDLSSLGSNTWELIAGLLIDSSLFYWCHKTNYDGNWYNTASKLSRNTLHVVCLFVFLHKTPPDA